MKANEIRTLEQFASYINEFIADYDNDSVLEEAGTIAKKNGWSLGMSLPYVCYNDSERLMYENGKAKVYTKMKPEEVATLERLADYILNECDNDYDICESDSEIITCREDGTLYVTSK